MPCAYFNICFETLFSSLSPEMTRTPCSVSVCWRKARKTILAPALVQLTPREPAT